MPTQPPTDDLAAVRARQLGLANALAQGFAAQFEQHGNLRRVVLYGPLEVDPTAVRATNPSATPPAPAVEPVAA